jgi:3-oxoacyl-[acyl-carrier protein] reductase
MRFSERVAVVIGAGKGGIGAAIVRGFAAEGARVLACDRDTTRLEALRAELREAANAVQIHSMDVGQSGDVRRMVETALGAFGKIDILVNCAGISPKKQFLEYTETDWDAVQNVNLKGAFLCARAVAEPMMARKYGRIVTLSSSSWRNGGVAGGIPYVASKAGIIGLTRSLARALGSHGITVNAVAPGPTLTALTESWLPDRAKEVVAQIPMGRLGRPEDTAAAALFLSSDEASYITGACLDVNGGIVMG